jgi:hypothetical protein
MNHSAEIAALKRRLQELEAQLSKVAPEAQPIEEPAKWPGPAREANGVVALSPDAKSYEERQAEERRQNEAAYQAEMKRRTEGLDPASGHWRDPFGMVRTADGRLASTVEREKERLGEVRRIQAQEHHAALDRLPGDDD